MPDMANSDFRLQGKSKHHALMISGAVRRYHTHPHVIGHQSVAEHTFRAMALMIGLWPRYTANALTALLCHDGAEAEVGDVPSPAKRAFPELHKHLTAAEDAVLERLELNFTLTDEERLWVKMCDYLEGAHFCLDQCRMGNSTMWIPFDLYMAVLGTLLLPGRVIDEMVLLSAEAKRLRNETLQPTT